MCAYIYTHNIIQPWKEWNLATCDNVDGSQGNYAKWNNSYSGTQILYGLS